MGGETQFSLGFSLPLGSDMQDTSMNLNVNHDAQGLSSQVNLSSSLGAEQQFDYNVGISQDRQQGASANTVASWHSAWSTLQGSFEAGNHSHSWSGGLSGALVALPDGVIFSPWYSETMALVDAPYAKGATVEGHSGLKLNDQGRALVPYMIAYHLNEIVLDPQGLPPDVELKSTRQQSAPYAGALVKVKFATTRGRAVLIHSSHSDGQSLPLGATVSDERGE
ncbi:fimbrial biogenesis outer membrane usher protein [Erwinia aphidicola]|nr:fimbrial biogenesis outer membrane usher protein [Erwinia aphidicola]